MTRTRLSLISTTAFASILGAAVPAFAQAPMPMAPAPMMAPAPVMAPAMPAAPGMPMMAPEAVMPVAPVVAPKAADDMSGSVGFGVGVVAGTDLLTIKSSDLSMKYWVNDAMALIPKLNFNLGKAKDQDASWNLAPSLLAEFGLIKGASTRFNAAIGLGLGFGKTPATTTIVNGTPVTTGSDDVKIQLFVPAGLNVEHFFTRWFSMGMGAYFNLIDFTKQGEGWSLGMNVNNLNYVGSLFIYTD
jgi:hypothetical protein